jgi:hypothetical protein
MFDEVLDAGRHVAKLQVASPAKLLGDVLGGITRPTFGGIEAEYACGVFVLTSEEIHHDGFEVGGLVVGLSQTRPSRPRLSTTR